MQSMWSTQTCLVVVFVHGRHGALVSDPDIHGVRVVSEGLDGQIDTGRHLVKQSRELVA